VLPRHRQTRQFPTLLEKDQLMQPVDFSLYIVVYNFIIGILIMIASEKLGVYAGYPFGTRKKQVSRVAHIAALAFGTCVAVLSGGVYIFAHLPWSF